MSEPVGGGVECTKSANEATMLHVSKSSATRPSKLWSDGAGLLEATITEWYHSLESELSPAVNCNLALWSNELYLLCAVASFSVAGNSDSELVLDTGIHRDHPGDRTATFHAEICRESGAALAATSAPPFGLDNSDTISGVELRSLVGKLRAFLHDQAPSVLNQLIAMEQPASLSVHASLAAE